MLTIIAAGDTAYVFPQGDERADMQATVCIGANLDTERFTLSEERWEQVRGTLGDDVEIVDCR